MKMQPSTRPIRLVRLGAATRETRASFMGKSAEGAIRYDP